MILCRQAFEVEPVALRRAAPLAAAQHLAGNERFAPRVPPLLRSGVVAARQPLPQNR